MSSKKFPIVYWKNKDGQFTAKTVSGKAATAVDVNLDRCVTQLKKYLQKKEVQFDYDFEPELSEFEVHQMKVAIRPKYENALGVAFPAKREFLVPVQYLIGTDPYDYEVCVFPITNHTFFIPKGIQKKELIAEQFKSIVGDVTPQQLVQYLNPNPFSTDSIFVKDSRPACCQISLPTDSLQEVARPLVRRERRALGSNRNQLALFRDKEVNAVFEHLKSNQGSLMLIGPPGVGKSTILRTAVRQMQRQVRDDEDFPLSFYGNFAARNQQLFWEASGNRVIAGMQYLGEWEGRLEKVIRELTEFDGVLCFEELESLVRLGGCGPEESIANFLIPYLENNEIKLIVEATSSQLERCRQILPRFDSLFTKLSISEFDRGESLRLLNEKANQASQTKKLKIDTSVASHCYQLFHRFMPYSVFPGKCYDFWTKQINETHKMDQEELKAEQIYRNFVELTGLPEDIIRDDRTLDRETVVKWFQSRIIGQPQVCSYVSDTITVFKSGLNDPSKPIHVMLFAGPTGVGKTETAKAINDYLFNANESSGRDPKNAMIRLDMSEYSGPGAADRMLIDGEGNPSSWIQSIRTKPFQVLLLDEIEKASFEVFDLLMGLFDEGRLTDRWGRTTDFRSTIVIMTSNLGVKRTDPIGFGTEDIDAFEKEIRKFFRPEFFNRIDKLLSFGSLERKDIQTITQMELQKVANREGFNQRNLTLDWTEGVVSLLVEKGYDRKLGARPLQRAVEKWVVTPISELLAPRPEISGGKILLDTESADTVKVEFQKQVEVQKSLI